MKIDDYLEQIQNSESMGSGAIAAAGLPGIDSFGASKKRKIIRRGIYPKRIRENFESSTGLRRAMIDFDGPIHKFSKRYQDGTIYDEPSEGVVEFIDWLKDKGFQIVIFTSRASRTNAEENGRDYKKEIINVENYLKENGIHYDLITAEKLAANFYIDDRAIFFNDWKSVKEKVIKGMNL